MQTHIIIDGVVVNSILATVSEAQAAFPDALCIDAEQGGHLGWAYDGERFTPTEPPERPFADLVREYDGHVQKRLDSVAAAMGYGDPNRPEVSPILHAISYADEDAVPKFQAEGRALRAWRSRYWAACWPILEAVRLEQRPVPTPADLIAELDAAAAPPPEITAP